MSAHAVFCADWSQARPVSVGRSLTAGHTPSGVFVLAQPCCFWQASLSPLPNPLPTTNPNGGGSVPGECRADHFPSGDGAGAV